ncbi:MAG: FecR domain-containing protein [Acidobacteria bacterium]|nr:FecR domain-containing protein [Acidobacteriota bacterium]
MSEDRLDKAIDAMKNESVDPEKLEIAQTRVRQKLEEKETSVCGEFQTDFQAYLQGSLPANRSLLLEDHLGRCPNCRTHLARLKGNHKIAAMPVRQASRWPRRAAWLAAAAVILCALYLGRDTIYNSLVPQGEVATLDSVDGKIYLVAGGILKPGDAIGRNDIVRTSPGAHARLRLKDGSLVDINESTELSIQNALSGRSIQLKRGDIIVQAAKQRLGHLRVQTRDSLTSVKGTVFAVSSGISGTLVSVVEGSVAVSYSGTDILLSPGEQEATNPVLESSVEQAISWSPDADTYIGMLASLVQVEKQIAELPFPQLPTQSQIIQSIPPNMFIYGAVPNIGDSLNQVTAIMEQQALENVDFSQWWNFVNSQGLNLLVDSVQTINAHLGNEIVYGITSIQPGATEKIPVILAEVKPGNKPQLEEAIGMLGTSENPFPLPYYLDDTLLLVSNTEQNLDWVLANLGQGAASSFASAIADRYSNNVGWLLGIDMESLISQSADAPDFVQAHMVKHLFFDQPNPLGIPENEMVVTFNGPRMGLTSFMADAGSGGAAEYITGEALAAGYIATREPQQLFEELIAQFTRFDPAVLDNLARAESQIGIDFSNDLARALGTESAFSLESVSTAGPAWTMVILVNDASTLEASIRRLVDVCNMELENAGNTNRILYSRDAVDGRTWTTVQSTEQPLDITWTFDRGYLVASSDRATALRAIGTRDGGLPLIFSSAFQQQLPVSTGLHPSGFVWLNTQGAFQDLAALVPNPAIRELITERDPILVVFDAAAEQIRAASRTRLSSVFMDLMLFQGLGKTIVEQQQTTM